MINIVIGNNASGKTLLIKQKMHEFQDAATNLVHQAFVKSDVSQDKVEILEEFLEVDEVRVTNNGIRVLDDLKDFSDYCFGMFNLLVSNKDVLVLDEPDLQLRDWEKRTYAGVCGLMFQTFKEVWVSTHDMNLINTPGAVFYKVKRKFGSSDVELIQLSSEELYDNFI